MFFQRKILVRTKRIPFPFIHKPKRIKTFALTVKKQNTESFYFFCITTFFVLTLPVALFSEFGLIYNRNNFKRKRSYGIKAQHLFHFQIRQKFFLGKKNKWKVRVPFLLKNFIFLSYLSMFVYMYLKYSLD